jgi:hypothetical protein
VQVLKDLQNYLAQRERGHEERLSKVVPIDDEVLGITTI